MIDIDDMILDQEEHELGRSRTNTTSVLDEMLMPDEEAEGYTPPVTKGHVTHEQNKILIGKVERFFGKLNVAAIELVGDLKIGDTIEIDAGGKMVRMKISGMQINKKDVKSASNGDSIGIKVAKPVAAGNEVYIIDQ